MHVMKVGRKVYPKVLVLLCKADMQLHQNEKFWMAVKSPLSLQLLSKLNGCCFLTHLQIAQISSLCLDDATATAKADCFVLQF